MFPFDIKYICDINVSIRCFHWLVPIARPVAPELQLLAVLPAQSALLLPEVLRPLVEDERHRSREKMWIFGGRGGL